MELKDYYKILGVAREADKKDIQLSFHQLARKYHPDVNPSNLKAEETFKAISEAYQVLSDVEQRQKYDVLRVQYRRGQKQGNGPQNCGAPYRFAQAGEGGRHLCDIRI